MTVGLLNIVIFSKDRGCQIDLLLRSMARFFPVDDPVNILYTWSSEEYADGYMMTIERHQSHNWVDEHTASPQYGVGFRAWVRQLIDPGRPYTMFLVDDNVFKEPFSLENNERFAEFKGREDVACFSLRMHPAITYCYTERRETPPPSFEKPGLWRWQGLLGDWGYNMSVDGHVFRTDDLLGMIHSLPYHCPNYFEGILANHPIMKPYMMCLEKSPVMNIPVNKVQTANGNHCGTIPADFLNSQYLSGKRLDLAPLVGYDNKAAHEEVPLTFLR